MSNLAESTSVTSRPNLALGVSHAVALVGVTGHIVDVEAHLAAGLPGFSIVGLPDTALSEARDRIRAAASSTGLALPARRITINLAPASLPKYGSVFDIAIAAAILSAANVVHPQRAARYVMLGELGLDGRVHPIRGVLPAVAAAVKHGYQDIIVAQANAQEASLIPDARVTAISSLGELAVFLGADPRRVQVSQTRAIAHIPPPESELPGDLRDVVGQYEARFALEIAAAGSHHMLMVSRKLPL